MQTAEIQKLVPNFKLAGTSGQFELSNHTGKFLVLYFYPKDNTSGCTTEGNDFKNLYEKFKEANTEIFGISKDSLNSHDKFRCAQEFPFDLLSDHEKLATNIFKVEKRSTFIIDPEGKLIHEWRNVKVPGHAQKVLDYICAQ